MKHLTGDMQQTSAGALDTGRSADEAADRVLQARRRIERAVDEGDLPLWVLQVCDSWERAAMAYGTAVATAVRVPPALPMQGSTTLH